MSTSNDSDQSATVKLLERRLKVICEIDRIRDEFESYDLRVVLINSLQFLVRELDVTAAFSTFYDAYHRQQTFSVGQNGLLRTEERGTVEEFFTILKEKREPFYGDPEKDGGRFFARPMIIDEEFFGIIGICQRSPDAEGEYRSITSTHEVILNDASIMLDTIVRQARHETLAKDELSLADQLDEITDTALGGLQEILSRMLPAISSKVDAAASLIFDVGGTDFELLAADSTGQILWDNSSSMQLEIKLCVQKCQRKAEPVIRRFEEDLPELFFAGKHLRSIVAHPLRTKAGESAGSLIVMSDDTFFDGHLKLINRAAAIIDTVILSHRRSDMLMRRMYKHVGTKTLDTLVQCPEWLDPRPEQVVILSADLVGSTEYAHREPDSLTVFRHINEYLAIVGDIVKNRYSGTLDKYLGDEVVGLFGAPVPDKDRAVNAVQCARCILNEVQDVNRSRQKEDQPVFNVKITLGLVNCVVGEVGSAEIQQDYTVIGSEVNRVFRIAAHAEANTIITNKALRDELADQFSFSELGEFNFKGVPEPLAIFRLDV